MRMCYVHQTLFYAFLISGIRRLAPEFAEDNLVNMTNLALKGIIGIGAIAQISNVLGFDDDGTNFQVRAFVYEGGKMLMLYTQRLS